MAGSQALQHVLQGLCTPSLPYKKATCKLVGFGFKPARIARFHKNSGQSTGCAGDRGNIAGQYRHHKKYPGVLQHTAQPVTLFDMGNFMGQNGGQLTLIGSQFNNFISNYNDARRQCKCIGADLRAATKRQLILKVYLECVGCSLKQILDICLFFGGQFGGLKKAFI